MKISATTLLLTGLAALAACGGGTQANKAANVTANDVYVVPDDVGGDDLLGNEVLLNDSGSSTNAAATNALGNTR